MKLKLIAKTIDIVKSEIYSDVSSETINKVYNGNDYSLAREEMLRAELALVKDEDYWFNRYFRDACYDVSQSLKSLNKSELPSYIIDEMGCRFLITTESDHNQGPLKDIIACTLVAKICFLWYKMKNSLEIAQVYKEDVSIYTKKLKGISTSGVLGSTSQNMYGQVGKLTYNIGLPDGFIYGTTQEPKESNPNPAKSTEFLSPANIKGSEFIGVDVKQDPISGIKEVVIKAPFMHKHDNKEFLDELSQEGLDANMKLVESMRRDLLNNMYVDNFPGLMTTYEIDERGYYLVDDWMSDGLNEMKKSLYDNSILKESTVDEKNTIYLEVEHADYSTFGYGGWDYIYCFSVILELSDRSKYIHNIRISTSNIIVLSEQNKTLPYYNWWLLSFVMPTREEFNAILEKHSIIGYKEISGIAPFLYNYFEDLDPSGNIVFSYVKFNVYKGGNTILDKFKQICTNVDNVKKSLTLIDTDSKKRDLILENETRVVKGMILRQDCLIYIGERRTGDGSGRNINNVKALKDINIMDTRVFIIPFIDSDLDVSYLKHCEYITSFNRQTQYPNELFLDIQAEYFDKDIVIENALVIFAWGWYEGRGVTFINCHLESCALTDGTYSRNIIKCIDCDIFQMTLNLHYKYIFDLSEFNNVVDFTYIQVYHPTLVMGLLIRAYFVPKLNHSNLSERSIIGNNSIDVLTRNCKVIQWSYVNRILPYPEMYYQGFIKSTHPYFTVDVRHIPDLKLKDFGRTKGYDYPRSVLVNSGVNAMCNKRSNWLQNEFIFPNNVEGYEVTIDLINSYYITSIFDKNENRDITWDPFVASNSVDDQMHGDLLIGKEKYPCLTIGIEDDLKTIVCYRNGFLSLNIAIDTFTIFPEGSMIDFDIVKNDIVIDTYSFKANQNKIKIELVEKVTAFDKIHVEIKSAIIGNSFGLIKIKTFAEYLNK